MAHDEEEDLRSLRTVLRRPDQRTWRRHLSRPAHAVRRGAGGGGDLRATAAGDPPPEAPDRPGVQVWQVTAAVLTLAAGVVLASGWTPVRPTPASGGADGSAGAPPDGEGRRGGAPSAAAPLPTTSAVRLWPAEAVEVHGREVRADGGRWEVGIEGDIVAIGDWDCDRLPTPAVLRPANGRVAVFDGWAPVSGEEEGRDVAAIAGATAIGASVTCGEIVVRAGGEEHVVPTEPSAVEASGSGADR